MWFCLALYTQILGVAWSADGHSPFAPYLSPKSFSNLWRMQFGFSSFQRSQVDSLSMTWRESSCLPARLGIPILTEYAKHHHSACTTVTAPLVDLIRHQQHDYPTHTRLEQRQGKSSIHTSNRSETVTKANTLKSKLSTPQQRGMEQASEKGASSWLTNIPLAKYGFQLHKQAFWDAFCLRYGWTPTRLASHCPCGHPFNVSHALSCPKGSMPTLRHNGIRAIFAQLLT